MQNGATCSVCQGQRGRLHVEHAYGVTRLVRTFDPTDVPMGLSLPLFERGLWGCLMDDHAPRHMQPGLTVADLERAAAQFPDTSDDPVAFRAHPASIDVLRRRLADDAREADPFGAKSPTTFGGTFAGIRLHRDLETEQGAYVPMNADEEREWLEICARERQKGPGG